MGRYVSTDVTLLKLKHTEAIIYCKLKEWLYIAVRDGLNFDGEKYFVNRTYPKLVKDLNLEFSRDAIIRIMGKLESKGLIKPEISENNNQGNKYYFPNQDRLLIEMHASHFHDINLGKVVQMAVVDKDDSPTDALPSANSPHPSANSLPPRADSPPLSLYQNNKINNKSKQQAAGLLDSVSYEKICEKFKCDVSTVNRVLVYFKEARPNINDPVRILMAKTYSVPEFKTLVEVTIKEHEEKQEQLRRDMEALEIEREKFRQRQTEAEAKRLEEQKTMVSQEELSLRLKAMIGIK